MASDTVAVSWNTSINGYTIPLSFSFNDRECFELFVYFQNNVQKVHLSGQLYQDIVDNLGRQVCTSCCL